MKSIGSQNVAILLATTILSTASIAHGGGSTTLTLGKPLKLESKSPCAPLHALFEFDGTDGAFSMWDESGRQLGREPVQGLEWVDRVRPEVAPTVEIVWPGNGQTAFLLVKGMRVGALPPLPPTCEGDGLLEAECDANWIWPGFEGKPQRPLQVSQ